MDSEQRYAEICVQKENTSINDFEMKKKQRMNENPALQSMGSYFITKNEIEKLTDSVHVAHVSKFFRHALFILELFRSFFLFLWSFVHRVLYLQ